jgi:peptidoglycan hydrolase-like protein with peptidoglycan-binding domain
LKLCAVRNMGEAVKIVQGLLLARGVAPRKTIRRDRSVDGVVGAGTESAAKNLQ